MIPFNGNASEPLLGRTHYATLTGMKKATYLGAFLFWLAAFAFFLGTVSGQGSPKDLGVPWIGLLPSNPFYFVKEWTRSVKRALTFDQLKKIEFELDIINEKAAEFNKLASLTPDKAGVIADAVANYELTLDVFLGHITQLKEIGAVTSIDKYLSRLLDLSLKHAELLSDLAANFPNDAALAGQLKSADAKVISLVIYIPKNLESMSDFKVRFQEVVASQSHQLKELKAAEVIDRMLTKISPTSALYGDLAALKRELLLRFTIQLKEGVASGSGVVNDLPVDPVARLKVLDTARKSVTDLELKNQLNALRQQTLEQLVRDGRVTEAEVKATIEQAKQALTILQSRIKSGTSLDQAKFYVDQAVSLYGQSNLAGAYSQAILAIGVTDESAAQQATVSSPKEESVYLRKELDRITALIKGDKVAAANATAIELLTRAEKLFVQVNVGKAAAVKDLQTIFAQLIALQSTAR